MPSRLGPRFAIEAIFLVLVAAGVAFADLSAQWIVIVMGAAWLLTAAVEWLASRPRRPLAPVEARAASWPEAEVYALAAPPEAELAEDAEAGAASWPVEVVAPALPAVEEAEPVAPVEPDEVAPEAVPEPAAVDVQPAEEPAEPELAPPEPVEDEQAVAAAVEPEEAAEPRRRFWWRRRSAVDVGDEAVEVEAAEASAVAAVLPVELELPEAAPEQEAAGEEPRGEAQDDVETAPRRRRFWTRAAPATEEDEPPAEEPVEAEAAHDEKPAEEPALVAEAEALIGEPVVEEPPAVEESFDDDPVDASALVAEPLSAEPVLEEPPAVEEPLEEEPAYVEEEPVDEPALVAEPLGAEPVVEEPPAVEEPLGEEPAPADEGPVEGPPPSVEVDEPDPIVQAGLAVTQPGVEDPPVAESAATEPDEVEQPRRRRFWRRDTGPEAAEADESAGDPEAVVPVATPGEDFAPEEPAEAPAGASDVAEEVEDVLPEPEPEAESARKRFWRRRREHADATTSVEDIVAGDGVPEAIPFVADDDPVPLESVEGDLEADEPAFVNGDTSGALGEVKRSREEEVLEPDAYDELEEEVLEPEAAAVEPDAYEEPEPEPWAELAAEPDLPAPPTAAPLAPPRLMRRLPQPREWTIWELERAIGEHSGHDPQREREWRMTLFDLRRHANHRGAIPVELDPLVRETFSDLIEPAAGA